MKYFRIGLMALICIFMISCASTADKAKKIEEEVSKNGGVLYKNLEGNNPRIITSSMNSDSTTVVLVHNLKTNSVDTLSQLVNGLSMAEVVPIEDGYVYVIKQERSDGKGHYLYQSIIKRNIDNPTEKTKTVLNVDNSKEELWASSYVIDREGKKVTLSSYEVATDYVNIYHTVYDFKGNKIEEDPVHVKIPEAQAASTSSSGGTYLWECQHCGAKVNSSSKPNPFRIVLGYGDGNIHQWVNIGRVG